MLVNKYQDESTANEVTYDLPSLVANKLKKLLSISQLVMVFKCSLLPKFIYKSRITCRINYGIIMKFKFYLNYDTSNCVHVNQNTLRLGSRTQIRSSTFRIHGMGATKRINVQHQCNKILQTIF